MKPEAFSPDQGRREKRLQLLFLVLAGFFIGNAMLAELVGGKLFEIPTGIAMLGQTNYAIGLSCGIVLWPLVFILTDIINEYFGRPGVKRLSLLAAAVIAYAFVATWVADKVPTASFSPIDAGSFHNVFLQSQFIIVGSITAFLIAQLVDVAVFWMIRRRTGHRKLWLRATGSTIVSQVMDTYVVGFLGLYLPYWLSQNYPASFADAGGLPFGKFVEVQTAGYAFKVVVALAITPVLYVVHAVIDRYLGGSEAERVIEETADREGAGDTPER